MRPRRTSIATSRALIVQTPTELSSSIAAREKRDAAGERGGRFEGKDPNEWLAPLRHREWLTGARDIVDQAETLGLEPTRADGSLCHMTMVTMP